MCQHTELPPSSAPAQLPAASSSAGFPSLSSSFSPKVQPSSEPYSPRPFHPPESGGTESFHTKFGLMKIQHRSLLALGYLT